jgi:hypothetical protein
LITLTDVFISHTFSGKTQKEVKEFANRKLNGELNFKEPNFSFYHDKRHSLILKQVMDSRTFVYEGNGTM